MATYKGIQGFTVQSLSSDPTASSGTVGKLWYNSGTGKFRLGVEGGGAWASGGDLSTARGIGGIAGTQTAAIVVGGYGSASGPPPFSNTNVTQTYDGSSWTTSPATLGTTRRTLAACGTTTATLAFGGDARPPGLQAVTLTEDYDGSSWTEVNAMNTAKSKFGGAGTNTAGLAFGGEAADDSKIAATEKFDGTSWTEVNALNTARHNAGSCGVQTSAMFCGGGGPSIQTTVETFDGTSWTTGTAMTTARESGGASGASSTAAIAYAGYNGPPGYTTNTEVWDGSSWTEVGNLAVTKFQGYMQSSGTSAACLWVGGQLQPPAIYTAGTEEFNSPNYTTQTVTVS